MVKLGAQLYTVREYIKNTKDFERSIKKLSGIGYNSVQISGAGNYNAVEYKKICDAYGVTIDLTHIDAEKILLNTQQVIDDHKAMQCKYIGIGSMPNKYRNKEWVNYFAEDFMPVLELIHRNGMKLMYHNHAFEFQIKSGEKDLLQTICSQIPAELMGITMDLFWVQFAGKDVCDILQEYKNRLDCVHLKDVKTDALSGQFAVVGEGAMDYNKIINKLGEYGVKHMFVEQDECYGEYPFDCLEKSYNNIQKFIK